MSSPHLQRKLKECLGDDAGEELAAVIDAIDPIRGDIAELRHTVRGDIAELRHAMEQGFARLEAKIGTTDAKIGTTEAKIGTSEAKMEAAIAASAKEQTRFLFLAWAVLLAAIVGLYSR